MHIERKCWQCQEWQQTSSLTEQLVIHSSRLCYFTFEDFKTIPFKSRAMTQNHWKDSFFQQIILQPLMSTSVAFPWWQLQNLSVVQLELKRFLHLNEHPKRIFWYLVRHFDWKFSKDGHFQFSESIFKANI